MEIKRILKDKRCSSRLNFERKGIMLKSKRSFEMPFSWLFAIIAGAIIIIIAITATVKIVNQGQQTIYSEAAKELGNMLNPVVNGFGSAYATKIDLTKETRVYLYCYETSDKSPIFGREALAFSEESGFITKWNAPGMNISRYNKFIFSKNIEQGKRLNLFSVPFSAGFRVDDLIMMNADNYCFVAAPDKMQSNLKSIGIRNINFSSTADLCPKKSTNVCFSESLSNKCNITVIGSCSDDSCSDTLGLFDRGVVAINSKSVPYTGNLIYAAIFSSPEIYSCNVRRLAAKINELARIYKDKADMVKIKDCNSMAGPYLDELITVSAQLKQSLTLQELYQIRTISNQMDGVNTGADCTIY